MALTKGNDYWYIGKYINFTKENYDPIPPKGQSYYWEVTAKKSPEHDPLGYIEYFPRWKKFVFFPYPNTLFEEICMGDICEFIIFLTKERKQSKVQ